MDGDLAEPVRVFRGDIVIVLHDGYDMYAMKLHKTPPSASVFVDTIWKQRYFFLAVIAVFGGLYVFGIREPLTVMTCDRTSQVRAKEVMKIRAKQNPTNEQMVQAAKADLYANEDYQPVFKACMVKHGYLAN